MATSVRLSENIEHRLDFLARKTGRTKAYYIREIISSHLDEIEDYYLAADVIERIRQGKETVFSSEEVRKELGLDD
jgi:RHH-type rel operon transcriptional repressor/antitoxin RelB